MQPLSHAKRTHKRETQNLRQTRRENEAGKEAAAASTTQRAEGTFLFKMLQKQEEKNSKIIIFLYLLISNQGTDLEIQDCFISSKAEFSDEKEPVCGQGTPQF